MSDKKEFVETLQEGFEEFMKDPKNKNAFAKDRKMTGFITSTQKIYWEPYSGDKKCAECTKTADFKGTRAKNNTIVFACDDCNYTIS